MKVLDGVVCCGCSRISQYVAVCACVCASKAGCGAVCIFVLFVLILGQLVGF